MLPPDVEPIITGRRGSVFLDEAADLEGLAPEVDGAGVTLALFAAFSGCVIGLIVGLLIGWVTA